MRAKRAFICVPKASLRENLRDLREKFWNILLYKEYVKVLPRYILRRFALMRSQSLTTLFLCLYFNHLKSGYIRVSSIRHLAVSRPKVLYTSTLLDGTFDSI